MKATIISPVLSDTKPLAICVVIPFETVEVSIALNNGVTSTNNDAKWLHKNDVRIFEKNTDKDLTVEILGSESNHTFDGEDLTLITKKVNDYEQSKKYDTEKSIITENGFTPKDLIEWRKEAKKEICFHFGRGINIVLYGCMNGNFIVESNHIEVYNGNCPEKALEHYNALNVKK